MEKAKELIEYRISKTKEILPYYSPTELQQSKNLPTDFQERKKTTDEETEPKKIIKKEKY
jgi:hypothetical protein